MFKIAFSHGQGPAFADLPPTLQPCAISALAPAPDHRLAASITGLIYAALAASILALSSLVPHRPLAPVHPQETWRPVILVPASTAFQTAFHPVSTGTGGGVPTVAPKPQPPAPVDNPDSAAPALSSEDHSQDPGRGVPGASGDAGGPGGLGRPGDPGGSGVTDTPFSKPAVHDFTSVRLAVLRQVDPTYPDIARRARIQGTVVLLMTIDESGQPLRVQVMEGHAVFHEAAIQAARQWRFEPARVEGRPVSASFQLTLKFSLR